ncbi:MULTISPECIES: FMN-dependent NADH-azoreductase [unclassified Leisingera]|uniref:FMN-dependent NADH-azoreductase n=1 Tax=unclassified Leisingera TaxID=2614906 RepID=UPI0002D88A78|nr:MULTISPECIES: NAD(P)H-dependent oxidoreductase [unclassified Leisingera]KIC22848.1 FMN-dependent NADH-azoreductase [Leisingera sp. ANG-S3]KIC50284.1 FMN-dependent NADH-azoreductase [Leisingera sp. ANG-S]KID07731.1 FMN-dependent NADH-azoreductase [Leisingera sp. ANG1]
MTKLLFIKASPRGSQSKSSALASAYLARLQETDSRIEIDVLDLSSEPLPDFDGDKVAAKMNVITGQNHDGSQRTAWDEITTMASRFAAADIYLIAAPMWNGSIPYKLKQYIDLIHQPGLLWGLDPETGYFGLLEGKRAVLALTSGAYGPDMPSPAFGVDHQSAYLKFWLNQAGVEDIAELRFQPTLLTADPEAGFQAAIAEAEKLAS